MKKCATAPDAMAFVRQHGIVLVSAKGPAPRLTEAIVGEAIAGSWWAHEKSRHIYATLQAIIESKQVLVCRLVDGKVTLVHRRLWPALVRLADRFAPEQLAQVHDEHTPTGRHVSREVPYPAWVPPHIMARGKATKESRHWPRSARGCRRRERRPGARAKVEALQRQVREIHLQAHLEEAEVISEAQAMQYWHLRGYAGGSMEHRQRH